MATANPPDTIERAASRGRNRSASNPPSRWGSMSNLFRSPGRNRSGDRRSEAVGSQNGHPRDDDGSSTTDSNEITRETDRYVDRMSSDPMGRILLTILKDHERLADKLKVTSNVDIAEVCKAYVLSNQEKEESYRRQIEKAEESVERKILEKEMNSSALDAGIAPPLLFSPTPTLRGWEQRKDALRLFPTVHKLSGAQAKDGMGMSVTEYLASLNRAQQHCML